jgi:nucleotide sugar dehydrogenase
VADRLDALGEHQPTLVFVAVDTPSSPGGWYDHRHVDRVLGDLGALGPVRPPVDLVLECTTSPGYSDSVAGTVAHQGYALSYVPGFVAQGSIIRDQQFPDQVLIGEADAEAGDRLERVYRRLSRSQPDIHRLSRLGAEIAKLATNSFLTMKIAFANAIGDLALTAGADPERVLDAVGADTRIGPRFLRYGFGYGGPCLPRDNRALTAFASRHGCTLLQAEATDEMNRRHLDAQIRRSLEIHPIAEPIHFHSVTYKPGTEILEESQPLALALALAHAGRTVVIHEQPAVLAALAERFGAVFQYRAGTTGST